MSETNESTPVENGRRTFIKRAAYVAPAVLTLSVTPAFAQSGSGRPGGPPGLGGNGPPGLGGNGPPGLGGSGPPGRRP